MEDNRENSEELDALCRECGHAFKVYVDRVVPDRSDKKPEVACPVCGCGECRIGR